MRRVEAAVGDQERLHPPGLRQRSLPPCEPPRKPGRHSRMADGLPTAEDPQAHPVDRSPQDLGLGHDDRHRPRKPGTHQAHLRHSVVLRERRLHGRRRQLDAVRQHERVAEPARDPHVPRVVDLREVACLQPAVAGVGRRHLSGPTGRDRRHQDAQRSARRAHEQLAPRCGPLVEPHLNTGQRRSHRATPCHPRIGQRDHGPGLGEAIPFHERHASRGEKLSRPPPQRRAPRHADPDVAPESSGEVDDPPRRRGPLEPLIEGGHAEDRGRRQDAAGIEHAGAVPHHAQAAAADQRRAEVARPGHRVAHRQPREPHVSRVVEKHVGRGGGIGRERPLRVEHAVRPAGGARRQHDRGGGVGIAPLDGQGHTIDQGRGSGSQPPPLRAGEPHSRLRPTCPDLDHDPPPNIAGGDSARDRRG